MLIQVPTQQKNDPVPAEMWKLLHYASAAFHRRKSRVYSTSRRYFKTEDFAVAVANLYNVPNDVAFSAESMRNIRLRLLRCPRVDRFPGGPWNKWVFNS